MPQILRLSWEDPITGDQRHWSGNLPITIGRDDNNTIPLHSTLVSRNHALLEAQGDRIVIRDLDSTNGILVYGKQVRQSRLEDGELFQIGPFTFTVLIEIAIPTPAETGSVPESLSIRWRKSDETKSQILLAKLPITIGRSNDSVLPLQGTKVSRNHATIDWLNGEWVLIDHNSTNGTLLNGVVCTRSPIPLGNEIQIGEFILQVTLPEPQKPPVQEQTIVDLRPDIRTTDPDRTAIYLPAVEETTPSQGGQESVRVFPPPIFDDFQIVPILEIKKLHYAFE
jgi:pSer/pThr/pTyr-binding forkhead associated (FHA) protein